jgi:hypothetical protein
MCAVCTDTIALLFVMLRLCSCMFVRFQIDHIHINIQFYTLDINMALCKYDYANCSFLVEINVNCILNYRTVNQYNYYDIVTETSHDMNKN